jgi:NitT/TauT family transport system substrate-binding protein
MTQSRAPRSLRPARPERGWRRTLGAVGGALTLAAAASACSSGSGSVEKSNLIVGVVSGIGAATFEAGVQQGDFSHNGLNVTVQPYATDAAAESALQKGQIDIAFGDYSEFFNVATSTVATTLQVVGEGYDAGDNTIGLVAAAGSSLESESLSGTNGVADSIANGGLSVDVPDLSSPEYLALANWEIAEQTPINLVTGKVLAASNNQDSATTAATMIKAVASGSVGAAVLQEPALTEALESGTVSELVNLDSGNAADMPISGWFALHTMVQKDPNTIAAFQAGLAEAQSLGQSRVDVEAALVASKVSHEVAATTAIGNYPTTIVAANLTNVLTLMSAANLTTAGLSAASLTGGSTGF